MTTVSAPGKLLLLGDHAVVYGFPCLVTAVDQRLVVTAEKTNSGTIEIQAPQVKDTRFIDEAVRVMKEKIPDMGKGVMLTTASTFSGVYGFGSSSAVTVGTIVALSEEYGLTLTKREIFDLAYHVVLAVQGVGSGFDVASAAFGGTILYTKGATVLEDMTPHARDMTLVVGYSGNKSNSVDIVNAVAQKKKEYPERVERIFEGIGKLIDQAKVALEEGDWKRLGTLMNFDQEYLRDLGVSTEKLEAMIHAAKAAGAYGAKLSGAGGGDCMIALVSPEAKENVEKAIEGVGGEVVHISINAGGAGLATTDNQEEQFIVVDANDNIVGYKTRNECHHDKSLIHRTVGVVISDNEGRILLQKRSKTKDLHPGMWVISSSGHVQKGQSYEDAAKRELQEELGIQAPFTFVKKFIVKAENETEMASVYKGVATGPFRPNPEEVEEVRFFEPREIALKVASHELPLTPGAVQSLQEVGVL